MSYRAIYAYAWNLADEGVDGVTGRVAALGIDTITVAGSYHAGKFLQPHGRSGKVFFPEDGTVYFNPDPARYGTIKPVLNSLVRERDVLREIVETSQIADQCLAGPVAQLSTRGAPSTVDGQERVRRPLRLQPLPVGAGRPRIRHRALP